MSDFSSNIRSRPRKTVELCLNAGLQAEWEALRADLDAVRNNVSTVNDPPEVSSLMKSIADLERRLRESTHEFVFESLPRRRWADLVAKHAPRKDNQTDKMLGYDVDAVTFAAARESLVSPELDDDDWSTLDDNLSHGQWESIKNAVLMVNAGKVDVPFLRSASRRATD